MQQCTKSHIWAWRILLYNSLASGNCNQEFEERPPKCLGMTSAIWRISFSTFFISISGWIVKNSKVKVLKKFADSIAIVISSADDWILIIRFSIFWFFATYFWAFLHLKLLQGLQEQFTYSLLSNRKLKWKKKIEKKIRQIAEVIPKHFGGLSTNPWMVLQTTPMTKKNAF